MLSRKAGTSAPPAGGNTRAAKGVITKAYLGSLMFFRFFPPSILQCDEERPKCRNCTQRELGCEYFGRLRSSRSSRIAIQDLVLSSDKGEEGLRW